MKGKQRSHKVLHPPKTVNITGEAIPLKDGRLSDYDLCLLLLSRSPIILLCMTASYSLFLAFLPLISLPSLQKRKLEQIQCLRIIIIKLPLHVRNENKIKI